MRISFLVPFCFPNYLKLAPTTYLVNKAEVFKTDKKTQETI